MAAVYAAFISYSHAADRDLSALLQRQLQRLGKPWYRRSKLKVFRDQTSLAATATLWDEIVVQLGNSQHFILMASPLSAASVWVGKEIAWWLENRSVDTLLIAVTDGAIAWNDAAGDFDWLTTDCLPAVLHGRFAGEPLYVDLRWTREPNFKPGSTRFRDDVLTLGAPLNGMPKDELDSEDIRQHQRFRIAAASIAVVIAVLTLAVAAATWQARAQATLATQNWREAESRRLASQSMSRAEAGETGLDTVALAVMAWRLSPTDEARSTLASIDAMSTHLARMLGRHTRGVAASAFSGDSRRFATRGVDGSILQWNTDSWLQLGPLVPGARSAKINEAGLTYDSDGSHLVAWERAGAIEFWDLRSLVSKTLTAFEHQKQVIHGVAISDGAALVAVGGEAGLLAVWDPQTDRVQQAPPGLSGLSGWNIAQVRFESEASVVAVASRNGRGSRVLRWAPASNRLTLGPVAALPADIDIEATGAMFDRLGQRVVLRGVYASEVAEIDAGLKLRNLGLATDWSNDRLSISADGQTAFQQARDHWTTWDIAHGPRAIATGKLPTIIWSLQWSPDGRWRVEGYPDEAQVWDARSAAPAVKRQLTAAGRCQFDRDSGDACIRELCRKVAPAMTPEHLRTLFGIRDYVVMFDKYLHTIGGSFCE